MTESRETTGATVSSRRGTAADVVERVRLAALIVLGVNLTFLAGRAALAGVPNRALWALLISVHAVFALVLLQALRPARMQSWGAATALLTFAALCVLTVAAGLLCGTPRSAVLLLVILVAVAATLDNWGLLPQLVLAAVAGGAVAWMATRGPSEALRPEEALSVLFAFAVSVYVARVTGRHRSRLGMREREYVRTERALRLVESAVEQANDAVIIAAGYSGTPREARVVYVNPAFARLTGFLPEQLAGRPLPEALGPGTSRLVVQAFLDSMRDGPSSGEGMLRRQNGSEYAAEWTAAPVRHDETGLEHWVCIIRDVSDRRRAEREKAGLLEVAREIAAARLDRADVLRRVQRKAAALLDAEEVATFLVEPDGGDLRLAALWARGREGAEEGTPVDADAELRARLEDGQAWVAEEPGSMSPALHRLLGWSRGAFVPLVARGRVLGLLAAGTRRFTEHSYAGRLGLLDAMGRQLAVALEGLDLYRSLEAEARTAAALARAGREMISSLDTPVILDRLCELAASLLECDAAVTLLYHRERDEFRAAAHHGAGEELYQALQLVPLPGAEIAPVTDRLTTEDVLETKRPRADAGPFARLVREQGFERALYIALRKGEELIGLCTAHRRSARPFTRHHRRLAAGLGHLASMALENARLVEELETANRVKADFVATMSHELRTPLNVIIGYSDLLLDGSFGTLGPEQLEPVRKIALNARNLLELITATLDLSRLDASRVVLEVSQIPVARFLEQIKRETWDARPKPGVSFVVEIGPGVSVIHSDAVKLKMVVKNLVTNAIKFTDEGQIRVEARAINGGVQFAVTDTGIGIPLSEQETIFEAFRQADSSTTRRFGGAGLGLYIAQRLTKVLGGSISLESAPGKGSVFRVWVPADLREPEHGAHPGQSFAA